MLNRVVMSIFAHSAALKQFLRSGPPNPVGPARPRREASKIRAGRAIFVAAAAALLAIGGRSGRLGIFGGRLG